MVAVATKKEVADMALGLLGQEPMATFDEATRNGRAIRTYYEAARISALEDAKWSFARKRVQMTPEATDPAFGFDKSYVLPADFIKEQLVKDGNGDNVDYVIENGKLLTDATTIRLLYTYNVETVGSFSGRFVEMFKYRLASKIAYLVTQSRSEEQSMREAYQSMLPIAISMNSLGEDDADVVTTSSWLADVE